MGSLTRLLVFGVAVWGLPFVIGFMLFPLVDPATALFDTLMSVALAFAATLFANLHLREAPAPGLDPGLLAGSVWMVMAILLDIPFFISGPEEMRMPFADYMADIGFTYAMIPIIAGGIGHALKRR